MSQRTVSSLILAIVTAGLFIFIPTVVLTIFAGILVAIFMRGVGMWLARPLALRPAWGIALLLVLLIISIGLGTFVFADKVAGQIDQLVMKLPKAVDALHDKLDNFDWGRRLIDEIPPRGLISGSKSTATAAISSTFGALGSFVVIFFIGIYGALDPYPYRRGLIRLVAPQLRGKAEAALDESVRTLRHWLIARLISMAVVGVLTAIGLSLIGLPLAVLLGIIAGLLSFIPNIGPLISVAPALLLAMGSGWNMLAWVAAIYFLVQMLESYLITPLVQQHEVHLPPAFVIAVQLMFGVLYGILGLALAMPLAAVAMTLISSLYVRDYLERDEADKA